MIRNLILATMMTTTVGTTAFRDTPQNALLTQQTTQQFGYTQDESWTYDENIQSQQEWYKGWYTYAKGGKKDKTFPQLNEVKSKTLKQIFYEYDGLDEANQIQKTLSTRTYIKIQNNSLYTTTIQSEQLLSSFYASINYYPTITTKVYKQWASTLTTTQKAQIDAWIDNDQTGRIFPPNTSSLPLWNEDNSTTTIDLPYDQELTQSQGLYIYIETYLKSNWNPADEVTVYQSSELSSFPETYTITYTYTINMESIDNYEVINVPEILFTILTMPFTFISNAFNLTLFPGTPYSINITNIIWFILTAFVFVFIIKKVLK